MMAPMPSAVSDQGPSFFSSRWPGANIDSDPALELLFGRTYPYAAMARDTAARFAIDERRVYAAGFSGGARVASRIGLAGAAAGVIACGGGFPTGEKPKTVPFALFAAAGADDFNYIEMRRLESEVEAAGAPHRLVIFDGGHAWPPAEVATQAIEWLELQAMRAGTRPKDDALIQVLLRARLSGLEKLPAAKAYFESKSIAADFKRLADVAAVENTAAELAGSREVREWMKSERAQEARQLEATAALAELAAKSEIGELRARVKTLRKSAGAQADSPERRTARRVLQGAFIQSYEGGREMLERKEYRRAAAMFELTTVLNPERGQNYYDLARARALAGDRKQALAALKQAAALGFAGLSGAAEAGP
jgi:predicted esterase